ncbi:aminoglycoside adenylyltransferase family protein [Pseudomonas sp. GD03860]|mgnify:CR=1 FL=1|uniref:aminoglycoside adenylyltransferase family protein n=1 Tax=Pseudomonas TaxID=286 RepID=UPI0023636B3C|nr:MULTISPECIES: aminoglycoside adenylyltransferase family protein [Pseudomonas]MDD2060269.1 aminoglycoside adenylyltransferase family protein [Pseudomonas putida]MDH0640008.1 aminoglycoside adenylyltransferase family protein [Pseudomonas sp. GD03860]
MDFTLPPTFSSAVAEQLTKACVVLERHLAHTLQAVHLYGSAVDGGLKPASDLDLLVTVDAPLAEPVRMALMSELLSVSAPPGEPLRALEVTVVVKTDVQPWRYPPRRELQFGEWLRDDVRAGKIELAQFDPDLAILLSKARQHSFCLLGVPATAWFEPVPKADLATAFADTLAQWNTPADWQGDELTVVLALARIWFSVETGTIAPKDIAAAWVLERLPPVQRAVLGQARDAYLGKATDNLADNLDQVTAFVHYCKARIERSMSSPDNSPPSIGPMVTDL